MSIEFSDYQKSIFNKLTVYMLEYNKTVNLTRIVEESEVWEKHYIDSVLPLTIYEVPQNATVIDVGTGAGFPGLPWKIYRPDLNLTLLDSLQKRINYLDNIKSKLNIDYQTCHGRSEEITHDFKYREKYNVAVSRAVANLPALIEYCLPFVKVGGVFLAFKGAKSECDGIYNALQKLGGSLENVIDYTLPSGDRRHLIVIKKISQTPILYPRKSTNITKKPL